MRRYTLTLTASELREVRFAVKVQLQDSTQRLQSMIGDFRSHMSTYVRAQRIRQIRSEKRIIGAQKRMLEKIDFARVNIEKKGAQ